MKKLIIIALSGLMLSSDFAFSQAYQSLIPPLQQISTSNSKQGWIYFKDPTAISPSNVFTTYANEFGLGSNDAMLIVKNETNNLGFEETWYQQYYNNIKVEGGEYIIHSKNGNVNLANGKICSNLALGTTPSISAQTAINISLANTTSTFYTWNDSISEQQLKEFKKDPSATYYPNPELVITMDGIDLSFIPANFKLAYKVDIYTKIPEGANTLYIDANTGVLIKVIPLNIACNAGTSQTMFMGNQTINTTYKHDFLYYTLENPCKGGGVETRINSLGVGSNIMDADNSWGGSTGQMAGGQAQWGTEKFYDYLLNTFGRKSFDNNNSVMQSQLNQYGTDNAQWLSTLNITQFLISGSNGQPNTYWVTNDIIGHEWGHGVTEFASGLVYMNESGAINESYSDIFGTLLEFDLEGVAADWTVAEDVYLSLNATPNYLRNMSDPSIKGDPDTYLGTNWQTGPGDNGGVHTNSGVMNYWFYLLSEGGSGTNSSPIQTYTYNVTGIGTANAAQIIYRGYNYLTSTSNYADARNAMIQSATDLFGGCSVEVIAVKEAWDAVGVYGTTPCMNLCVNSTNAGCSVNNGIATVNVTGGSSPYTYQWYNAVGNTPIVGETSVSINSLAVGTYYVIVQDNASCTEQSLNVIILGGTPTLSFTTTNANCTGPNADGSATVIPTGGLPPYTYQWDANASNQTTSTADNLPMGTYNVTVTDANACAVNGSTTVNAVFTPFDITYGTQITTSTIWNAPLVRVDGYVEVVAPATLTIASGTTVEFIHHPDFNDPMPYGVARLIVQPGAFLTVSQNSTLTGCSGGTWDGIELWGTGIFDNGAANANILGNIENADIGVFTNRRPKKNQSIVNSSGGTFRAFNCKFLNCRRAIVIAERLTINPFNYNITDVTFTYDRNSRYIGTYNTTFNDLPVHITAEKNISIILRVNNFFGGINHSTGELRGTGLLCNDCKPLIMDHFGNPNTFAGLTRAIEANYISTNNQLRVIGNNIIADCQEGIYMQGSSLALIQNTTFKVPAPVLPNTKTYGIFSVSSDGFDISGNTISPVIPDANTYGMVFENSGAVGGVVFNNTFNNVGIGLQAQKNNQNLKVGCNNFNNPVATSLAVVNVPTFPTSLMRQQGLNCAADGNPAGNEWVYTCNTSTSTANVFADNNVTFKYFSYNANQVTQPYTQPLCSSPIWEAADMQPWVCGINKTINSCNSVFRLSAPPPLTPYPVYFAEIQNLITDYKNQLDVLKPQLVAALLVQDGGNTQNLLNNINQSKMSNGQLKNLLVNSNALSDKVLIAAINRNPSLPSGILKDILFPQAPLSVAVLTALENLSLPNGIKNNIYQAQINTPQYIKARDIENDINYFNGEIILLESEYQRKKLELIGNTCKECKFSNSSNVDVIATQDFAAKNEPDSVRMMLNVIQTDTTMDVTEKQNFVSYMNVIADLLDSNQTIYTANTAQIATIQTIATTNTKAGAHANAGLKARKLPNHHYKIEDIPVNNLRLMNNEEQPENHEKTQLANTGTFILYPNPNKGTFQLQLKNLEDDNAPVTITITNLLGQVQLQKTISVLLNLPIEIKDKTFAKGVYLVIVTQNNLPIGQSKIIIE